jgi:amidase
MLCRTVKDAATVLSAVAGYDPRDPATAASEGQVRPYPDDVDAASLNGVRLGVVREFMRVHTKADEDAVAVVALVRDRLVKIMERIPRIPRRWKYQPIVDARVNQAILN